MADKIRLGKAQILGQRKEQQDALGFNYQEKEGLIPRGGILAVVADGVGGHSHGKGASSLAVRSFLQAYQSVPKHKTIPDSLFYALHVANNAVCEFAKAQGEPDNCATTLTAVVVEPETRSLYWISVGDSRLYLLREQQWIQVTVDGNYESYLRKRVVKEVETRVGTEDHEIELMALTSFLGKKSLNLIDRNVRPFALQAHDWLVLCTDGLYNTLNEDELIDCMTGAPQNACDLLVRSLLAKELVVQDNGTVAILGFQARAVPIKKPLPLPPMTPIKLPENSQTLKKPGINKHLLGLALTVWLVLALSLGAGWMVYLKAKNGPSPDPHESFDALKPLDEIPNPIKAIGPDHPVSKP